MKLTKETLKQLIKEELEAVMGEQSNATAGASYIRTPSSDEQIKADNYLEPKQYTIVNQYGEEDDLSLYIKNEDGWLYFAMNASGTPDKIQQIILNQLKPAGYEGVGIVGPNSHLR